jgi:hypothetical protein
MIDERLEAIRRVRREADRLRMACIGIASTSSLLHIAYDAAANPDLPATFAGLLNRIR